MIFKAMTASARFTTGYCFKDLAEPWFTVRAAVGLMLPPDPAEGVTVYYFKVNIALTVQAPTIAFVV